MAGKLSMAPLRSLLVVYVSLMMVVGVAADSLYQEYCSDENTGSDYSAVFNIYQSNGACFDQCKGDYAFAVVQWQNCWCSNYIPAAQSDASSCNQNCPGYPAEQCGNQDSGLYGYIPLLKAALGTAGATSSPQVASSTVQSSTSYSVPVSTSSSPVPSTAAASTTSSQVSSFSTILSTSSAAAVLSTSSSTVTTLSMEPSLTSDVQTSSQSSTTQPTIMTTFSSVVEQSSISSTTPPTTSSTSSSTSTITTSTSSSVYIAPVVAATPPSSSRSTLMTTPSPVTSTRVVTLSGAIVTETVTSTPIPVPNTADSDLNSIQRKGLSGGAIAGITIAILLGLGGLLFGAFMLWRRKKRDDADDPIVAQKPRNPRRNISIMSKAGLLSRGRPTSFAEKEVDDGPYGNMGTGDNSVRHSMLFGASIANEGVSPVSPLAGSHDNSSRRFSRPMVYDQRLNPSALFANPEMNGSRISMQDMQDYSRPLGIANPDIRTNFESRTTR